MASASIEVGGMDLLLLLAAAAAEHGAAGGFGAAGGLDHTSMYAATGGAAGGLSLGGFGASANDFGDLQVWKRTPGTLLLVEVGNLIACSPPDHAAAPTVCRNLYMQCTIPERLRFLTLCRQI